VTRPDTRSAHYRHLGDKANRRSLSRLGAARQALSAAHHAQPRRDGPREALRLLLMVRNTNALARTAAINTLKALILTAPDDIREQLRGRTVVDQLVRISGLRVKASDTIERRTLIAALRGLASRIRVLDQDMRTKRTRAHRHRPQRPPGALRPARRRPVQRRPATRRVLPPRSLPQRSRVRRPRRRRPARSILRPRCPSSPQPARRSPAQPSTAHHRHQLQRTLANENHPAESPLFPRYLALAA
jgi:hypothetical protein